MTITIKDECNDTKKFGDLHAGDTFYIRKLIDEYDETQGSAWDPNNPFLKICDSHGESRGAAFRFETLYEEEFDDDDIVCVYKDSDFVFSV